jgi:PilZ domain
MVKDKRKSLRRPIRYSAWVALEADMLHGCVMSDISDTGARLDIDDSQIIPDDFTLLLTSNGSAHRKCHVVWRKPRQLGVTFERRAADGVTLVPKSDAAGGGAPPEPVDAVEAEGAESA